MNVDLFFTIVLDFLYQLLSEGFRKIRVSDVIDRFFVVGAVLDVLYKLHC